MVPRGRSALASATHTQIGVYELYELSLVAQLLPPLASAHVRREPTRDVAAVSQAIHPHHAPAPSPQPPTALTFPTPPSRGPASARGLAWHVRSALDDAARLAIDAVPCRSNKWRRPALASHKAAILAVATLNP